jgi:transcriptional regulator with XRE-family HTH domain
MIGERLKELREKKNMTQDDLCKELNIRQATLSHYENNKRTPDLEMLIKISKVFGVSIDYLADRYK